MISLTLDSCVVRCEKDEILLLVQDTNVLRKHLNMILSTAFPGKQLG